MLRFFLSVGLLLMLSTLTFGQTSKSRSVHRADERQAGGAHGVEEAIRGYAESLRAGTVEAVTRWYTTDGELLLPGLAKLHGREAIRTFLMPLVAATEVESVEMKAELIEIHGKRADSWGTYSQVAGEKGKPKQTYHGRYASLWQLENAGHWRIVRLMMQPLPENVH